MVLELRSDNQTIGNIDRFEYSINLNEINRAVIIASSNTLLQLSLLSIGTEFSIYRNNVLEYIGKINNVSNFEGNGLKLFSRGKEEEYIKQDVDTSTLGTNGIWNSTASATIYAAILNKGVVFSAGTVATGVTLDFKVANSDSLFNSFLNLHKKTGQEQEVIYSETPANNKINIVDALGSLNVDTLNLGSDFEYMEFSQTEPVAKKIIVYGKGDGDNQITATATDGGYSVGSDNVKVFRDPTIISTSEAQQRANIELSKLKQNVKTYRIPVNNPLKDYYIGDTLTVNASTYAVDNESVRITRVVRGMLGDTEFLNIEVTNTEHSLAFKNASQELSKQEYENRAKDTHMQGSGNTLTFGNQINADSTSELIVPFQLPADFITDEAGNIRVTSMTVDYDIDPYRKSVGGASYDGSDPQVQNISGSDDPDVNGTGGSNTLRSVFVSSKSRETDSSTSSHTDYIDIRSPSLTTGSIDFAFINVNLTTKSSTGSGTLSFIVKNNSVGGTPTVLSYSAGVSGNVNVGASTSTDASVNVNEGDWLQLDITGLNPGAVIQRAGVTITLERDHTHSAGGLAVDNHNHTDGSYDILATDIDDITIGDGVSDAASVNSTSVSLYLDFWNGSAWVNKHSILTTGQALDTDVDITDSGTYPDSAGFWRVRVVPNSGSADLVKGIVKLKHSLDN